MLRLMILLLLIFSVVFGTATAQAEPSSPIPAAYQLHVSEVARAVEETLIADGAGQRIKAQVTGMRKDVLYESSTEVVPKLTGLTFDKATGRWTANLLIVNGDKVLTAMPLSGRFQEVAQLPVLKRQLRNGDVISDDDLDTMEFPINRTRKDVITESADLLGRSPRGVISAGRPIRTTELSSPSAVKKNTIVQMQYVSGAMEIVASGQALTDGAVGDVVEIKNLASKNVVRGVVKDARTVVLSPEALNPQLAGDVHATAR